MHGTYEIPRLSADQMTAGLEAVTARLLRTLTVYDELASTNLWLKAQAGGAGATVVLAERQTAGRGRRGKSWHSPACHNLYLSLDWVFAARPDQLAGLSLGVGIKLAEVLAPRLQHPPGLKWPNDLFIDGQKLAGILIESIPDPTGHTRVIIGVGLNVLMQGEQRIDQPWTSLVHHVKDPASLNRNTLASLFLNALLPFLDHYLEQGDRYIQQHWFDHDLTRGQPVEVLSGETRVQGIGDGIDEQFRFRMRCHDGCQRSFSSGDISLRLR